MVAGMKKMIIDCGLAIAGKSEEIGDKGNVKKHVMLKDQRSRSVVVKGRIRSTVAGLHSNREGFVDEMLSFKSSRWGFQNEL